MFPKVVLSIGALLAIAFLIRRRCINAATPTSLPVIGNILNSMIFFFGLGVFCLWWIKRDRMTVKHL
ncbi:hypothetical protein [Nostoc sp. DedQUE09]|uniref:hypothetical protein n=1 Tax=Nostoc sp. DedQUE09 TaxID=3075394 RepID=UPI002AD1F971|nr:hypothetical protein [Nostoc sp. DedQUE09]MDZ7952060.1 hypothetical protein [Nostoc sp. DedQUE09]